MKSVMKHSFSMVPRADIPRSSFDRSHGFKTAFDAGKLIPILVDEALPGDTFNLSMTGFARLATPLFPLMDNMYMSTFFFAVPHRLIWDNWEKFCGSQVDPGDSTDYLIPTIDLSGGVVEGHLLDYMGIPPGVDGAVSALPTRAYNLIYNEWFRDENLQDSVVVDKDDGPDTYADYGIWRRGKRHDYFTSCLPWPQKGDSVELPLGTTADVVPNATLAAPTFQNSNPTSLGALANSSSPTTNVVTQIDPGGAGAIYWDDPNLQADLSTATAATINQLRQAFQIQKLLERDARGGTRYTEVVRAHFGVVSPDQRLQRPEYLGGGRTPVIISPIANTTSITGEAAQGTLAGIGTASLHGHGFTKSFTEHCVIIGLVCVDADLTYQQGVDRMWWRSTRYDYYWPALAHIGEQAVLNKEIYFQGAAADDDVFGYQERYAEYRYKPSRLAGAMRSSAATPLDAWHLSQEFASLPALDATFIVSDPPVDRVIAVDTEPHFIFDSYFQMRCARPMPLFGVPGLIDHF